MLANEARTTVVSNMKTVMCCLSCHLVSEKKSDGTSVAFVGALWWKDHFSKGQVGGRDNVQQKRV